MLRPQAIALASCGLRRASFRIAVMMPKAKLNLARRRYAMVPAAHVEHHQEPTLPKAWCCDMATAYLDNSEKVWAAANSIK